jgi:hypothetical protein
LAYADNLAHLPPKTSADVALIAERDHQAAELLAAHLAFGRASPELATRTLLDSTPAWLLEGEPGNGFAVLADYAHAHGLEPIAAEALLKAAALNPVKRFRYPRNAALTLLNSDREGARSLFDEAAAMQGADNDVRLLVGYAILKHPDGSANPSALDPDDEARLNASANDEFILTFLAQRAEFGGDLNKAVELSEQALALDGNASGFDANCCRNSHAPRPFAYRESERSGARHQASFRRACEAS